MGIQISIANLYATKKYIAWPFKAFLSLEWIIGKNPSTKEFTHELIGFT